MLTPAHRSAYISFSAGKILPWMLSLQVPHLQRNTGKVGHRIQQWKKFWCLGPLAGMSIGSTEPSSSSLQAQRELYGHGKNKVEKEQIQKWGCSLRLPVLSLPLAATIAVEHLLATTSNQAGFHPAQSICPVSNTSLVHGILSRK